jgi:hypothetical protein
VTLSHQIQPIIVLTVCDAEASATPTPTTGGSRTSTRSANDEDTTSAATTGGRQTGDLNTARVPTGSRTGTATRSRTTSIDDTAPVGGISMVTPAPTAAGLNLYKIGTNITFGWNYTNVVVNPTAIDVLASCSAAARVWTLTANMTWETEGSYTWDTQEQATDVQSPLLTEQYTLIIHDADAEVTDAARPGYLGTSSGFTFKMYKPQDYVPRNEWKCPTCSAAPPSLNSKGLPLVLAMSAATVMSFTWFVTGMAL